VNLKTTAVIGFAFAGLSYQTATTPRAAAPVTAGDRRAEAAGPIPLVFEVNRGQAAGSVTFLARRPGHTLLLTPREALMVLDVPQGDPRMVRMRFDGARADSRVEGRSPLAGRANYLIGSDPHGWTRDIPLFGEVVYRQLYPAVDLVLRGGAADVLEYDFVIAPGGRPADIALRFDGADRVEIDAGGNLQLTAGAGVITERKPVAYQEQGGVRRDVPSRFVMRGGGRVGFEVGAYDSGAELVIDPPFLYSTFIGGDGSDRVNAIATDSEGKVHVTGQTNSLAGLSPLDFPAKNPLPGGGQLAGYPYPPPDPRPHPVVRKYDAFVGKLDTTQSGPDSLVYMTFFGGALGDDRALAIAVDGLGRPHVGGVTSSKDLPLVNALQTCRDASNTFLCDLNMSFFARLSADGSAVEYSSYLNGANVDTIHALAVGPQGRLYIAGGTGSLAGPSLPVLPGSPNYFYYFPVTPDAVQTTAHGSFDAFLAVIDLDTPDPAQQLVYSTLVGGCSDDEFHDIAVDALGRVAATGQTQAPCTTPATLLPIVNAFQPAYQGGLTDALVARIDPSVAGPPGLVFSTRLGGKDDENDLATSGLALDASGNIHLAGKTSSANFPTTAGAAQRCPGMSAANAATYPCDPLTGQFAGGLPPNGVVLDGYVTTLSPSGALLQSTFVGGAGQDDIKDIAVRPDGAYAYIVGGTTTAGLGSSCAPQPALAIGRDAFQATIRLTPQPAGFASALAFWTYLGGGGDDFAYSVAYNTVAESVFVGGYTTFTTSTRQFPTTANALQAVSPGSSTLPYENGFLTEIPKPTSCAPDLVVRKFGTPEPVAPGCAISYTIEVENHGVTAASQVVVTDDLPAPITLTSAASSKGTCSGAGPVTCDVGTLAVGEIATITLTGDVAGNYAPTEPPIVNTASATSLEVDGDASSNTASWTTHVAGSLPGFSVGSPSVVEGDSGTTDAVFTVTLSAPACIALPFSFATATVADPNVAAEPSQDFTASNGAFSIPAGQTTHTLAVAVTGDTLVETDEQFELTVTAGFNGPVIDATGTATIVNDDAAPVVSLAGPAAAGEGSSAVYAFTVAADAAYNVMTASCGSGALAGAVAAQQDPGGGGSGSVTCQFGSGPDVAHVTVQVQSEGNASNVAAVDVAVTNVPPVATLSGPQAVDSGAVASFDFGVADAGGDGFVMGAGSPGCGANGALVAGSLTVTPAGGSFQCQFGAGPATSGVSVQVIDSDGAPGNVAALTVTIAAPVAPPPPPPSGGMRGNGSVRAGARLAQIEIALSCVPGGRPAQLAVTLGPHRFRLNQVTATACSGSPVATPRGTVPFSVLAGSGAGRYDRAPGYLVSFQFVDGGAANDTAAITVTAPNGDVVLAVSGPLVRGRIRAR